METFDVVILGGGPGGYAAALRAALRGARVCLIESGPIGGTCLNTGCIPTKAMLHASALFHEATHAGPLGLEMAGRIDGPRFMSRVAGVVENLRKGVETLLSRRKVTIVRGRGRLSDPHTVTVESNQGQQSSPASPAAYGGKAIILATGSRPALPAFLPKGPRVLTTDQAATAGDLPQSILIVGGGVIGCEFATMYSELGVKVMLVEMLDRLLPVLGADASRVVHRSLQQRGVEIILSSRIERVVETADGVRAEFADGKAIDAQQLLAAVGRVPNSEGIGLEEIGVAMDGRIVKVDEHCRTNVPGVYAIGDLAERLQYAHLAARMGAVAADCATGHEAADDRKIVPIGVYTHPEVASVGLTEEPARAAGRDVRVAKFPYVASGMAQAYGQTEGAVKLIAESASGRLVGALVIGPHATDVIQEIALALRKGLTIADVAGTIHPHPTFVEALGESAEAWLGLPMHVWR